MKRAWTRALATWLVEHLTFGLTTEALAGDLVEEMQKGRSAGWLWRQVLTAITAGLLNRLRDSAAPLVFCVVWTSLYPGWNLLCRAMLENARPENWETAAWPWSALLPLSYGMVPALAFVWVGFRVYALARPAAVERLTARRVLWGLSASLNVLLSFTVLLLRHFKGSRVDLGALEREDFYSAFHLLWISVPLALSLLAALWSTTMQVPRLGRKQGLRPPKFSAPPARFAQGGPIA